MSVPYKENGAVSVSFIGALKINSDHWSIEISNCIDKLKLHFRNVNFCKKGSFERKTNIPSKPDPKYLECHFLKPVIEVNIGANIGANPIKGILH